MPFQQEKLNGVALILMILRHEKI